MDDYKQKKGLAKTLFITDLHLKTDIATQKLVENYFCDAIFMDSRINFEVKIYQGNSTLVSLVFKNVKEFSSFSSSQTLLNFQAFDSTFYLD